MEVLLTKIAVSPSRFCVGDSLTIADLQVRVDVVACFSIGLVAVAVLALRVVNIFHADAATILRRIALVAPSTPFRWGEFFSKGVA